MKLGYGNTGSTAYLPTTFTDAARRQTTLSYDGNENLQGESNGGTSSTVHHNSDGTIDYVQAPSGDRFTYHCATPSNHMLTSVTPPSGNLLGTVTLSHDGFNRIASRGDGRSGETASTSYNPAHRRQLRGRHARRALGLQPGWHEASGHRPFFRMLLIMLATGMVLLAIAVVTWLR